MKKKFSIVMALTAISICMTACGTEIMNPLASSGKEVEESGKTQEQPKPTQSQQSGENASQTGNSSSENKEQTNGTEKAFDYQALEGSYNDSYSQRAYLTVKATDDKKGVFIEVAWSSSWCEYTAWHMSAVYDQKTGRLVYEDEEKQVITSDDAGTGRTETIYQKKPGYFAWEAQTGTLKWTGAYDENCRDCVFEKSMIPETAPAIEPGEVMQEILKIYDSSVEIEKKVFGDLPMTGLSLAAKEYYELWDGELNSLWSRISKEIDAENKKILLKEQREWIQEKEQKAKASGEEFAGGSLQPYAEAKTAAEMTFARCLILARDLADLRGEYFQLTPQIQERLKQLEDVEGKG